MGSAVRKSNGERIREYKSAVLKLYQQELLVDDLFGEPEEPALEEVCKALLTLHEAREAALQAWEQIPPDRRDGLPVPPPSE